METEDYNPEPPKFYQFRGKQTMEQTISKPYQSYNKVNILCCHIPILFILIYLSHCILKYI